jgi:hypothetical protein
MRYAVLSFESKGKSGLMRIDEKKGQEHSIPVVVAPPGAAAVI